MRGGTEVSKNLLGLLKQAWHIIGVQAAREDQEAMEWCYEAYPILKNSATNCFQAAPETDFKPVWRYEMKLDDAGPDTAVFQLGKGFPRFYIPRADWEDMGFPPRIRVEWWRNP
jgi:hypothetical protein